MPDETIKIEPVEAETLRAALGAATGDIELYKVNVTRLEEENERWAGDLHEASSNYQEECEKRQKVDAELARTKEALQVAEALNNAFVDRATNSGGSEQLRSDIRATCNMLKRWRTDGATDHRLPRDTVDLLERLGETL